MTKEMKLEPPSPNGPENIPLMGYIKSFDIKPFGGD